MRPTCKCLAWRPQEEARVTAERNTEMAGQVHSLTANLRHLEVENARLTDGHAMLRVELEARAAESRSARGEAAELAADRARLLAEMQQQKPVSADDDVRFSVTAKFPLYFPEGPQMLGSHPAKGSQGAPTKVSCGMSTLEKRNFAVRPLSTRHM